MRRYIRPVTIIPRIPQQIHIPAQDGDVLRRRNDPSHGIDVVFRTDVHVPQHARRQSRHRVVVMRHSEIAPLVLLRDVITQRGSGDARCAVRVEIGVGARLSDLGGGDVGDGAAEAVPDYDDAVGGVGGSRGFDGCENAGAGFEPAVVAVAGF